MSVCIVNVLKKSKLSTLGAYRLCKTIGTKWMADARIMKHPFISL